MKVILLYEIEKRKAKAVLSSLLCIMTSKTECVCAPTYCVYTQITVDSSNQEYGELNFAQIELQVLSGPWHFMNETIDNYLVSNYRDAFTCNYLLIIML